LTRDAAGVYVCAAAEWSQPECLKQLVKFGAKMDAPRTHPDRAPLFACVVKHDDPEIVRSGPPHCLSERGLQLETAFSRT
jgi:hypothetical protein